MRLLQTISADEMVAHFLRTEIHSSRFGSAILGSAGKGWQRPRHRGQPRSGRSDCKCVSGRAAGRVAGLWEGCGCFHGLSDDVVWYRGVLDRADWERVMYIDDEDFWNEFSGGSRLVRDAVQRIYAGEVPTEEAAWFWPIADALAQGQTFPELILVYNPTTEELVLLEGHVRMTGFLLRPQNLPSELPVLLGVSPHMKN